jgi:hypothetical protein
MNGIMCRLPDVECYGNFKNSNYGINTLKLTTGPIRVWFSYTTPVAFKVAGLPIVISQNVYSRTTGKHINWIDGGRNLPRVSREEFHRLWDEQATPFFDDNEECLQVAVVDHPYDENPQNAVIDKPTRRLLRLPELELKKAGS